MADLHTKENVVRNRVNSSRKHQKALLRQHPEKDLRPGRKEAAERNNLDIANPRAIDTESAINIPEIYRNTKMPWHKNGQWAYAEQRKSYWTEEVMFNPYYDDYKGEFLT